MSNGEQQGVDIMKRNLWTIRQLMAEPNGKSYSWYIAMIHMDEIKAEKIGTTWVVTEQEKKRIESNPPKLNRKRYLALQKS